MGKLKSRKFWVTLLSTLTATATSLIAIDGTIGKVCAIISLILPPIIYVITEGNIDAKAVEMSASAVNEIKALVEAIDSGKNETECKE